MSTCPGPEISQVLPDSAYWLPGPFREDSFHMHFWEGSGLKSSSGEGKGYPLQSSGLENSMDCMVHAVAKSRTQQSRGSANG